MFCVASNLASGPKGYSCCQLFVIKGFRGAICPHVMDVVILLSFRIDVRVKTEVSIRVRKEKKLSRLIFFVL